MASRRRTLLKNLYSEKEEDVDVNINLIVPKKEKTCTVCIQQRLNYKNGTILNEKFVTVENKKTCHDIKIMKNIIEQNTPTTFGNPCGFYQRDLNYNFRKPQLGNKYDQSGYVNLEN